MKSSHGFYCFPVVNVFLLMQSPGCVKSLLEMASLPIVLTGPMSCSRIHHVGHYIFEGSPWIQFLRCSLTLMTVEVLREHGQVYCRAPTVGIWGFLICGCRGRRSQKGDSILSWYDCDPGPLTEIMCPHFFLSLWKKATVHSPHWSVTERLLPSSFKLMAS